MFVLLNISNRNNKNLCLKVILHKPTLAVTCNAVSDDEQCHLQRSARKGNCENGPRFIMPKFFIPFLCYFIP